jgi:hypothetical protein
MELLMKERIEEIRRFSNNKRGEQNRLIKQKNDLSKDIIDKNRKLKRHEQAKFIVRKVGLETQKELEYNISEIVNMALEIVFDDPYKLKVEFVQRRNKTECDLFFERDKNLIKPLDDSGGGALDVASFALRLASWTMQTPHTMPLLLLDEPFKHLKGEESNLRVLEMIHKLGHELGLQIIMVSDERVERKETIKIADRTFLVSMINKISKVEQLKK